MIRNFKRLLHRRKNANRREEILLEIREMGYDLVDASGVPYAGTRPLAYFVRTPSGEILRGPLGEGFARMSDARAAARTHRESGPS